MMIYTHISLHLLSWQLNCVYVCTAEEGFRAETYCTVYHCFAALKEDTVSIVSSPGFPPRVCNNWVKPRVMTFEPVKFSTHNNYEREPGKEAIWTPMLTLQVAITCNMLSNIYMYA